MDDQTPVFERLPLVGYTLNGEKSELSNKLFGLENSPDDPIGKKSRLDFYDLELMVETQKNVRGFLKQMMDIVRGGCRSSLNLSRNGQHNISRVQTRTHHINGRTRVTKKHNG